MMGVICWGLLSQPRYFALCCVSGWVRVLLYGVWWEAPVAPCPFPPPVLKWMSWWVRIGGCCCLVLASPDGLSSRAQHARYTLKKKKKKGLSKRNEQPTRTAVKCTRAKRECGFIRPGNAAGQRLIEVQLFPQTSLTLVNDERKHCWIIYCASVACRMQRGVKIHS